MSVSPTSIPSKEDSRALEELGATIRALRTAAGTSRTRLAETSGLSLRFLAQVEAGQGNISYLRLGRLAHALGTDAAALLDRAQRLSDRPVVLLGMRGAGKSTIGPLLARALEVPFLELDEMVEDEAGMSSAQIFELQGESFFRRLEREALARFLAGQTKAVVAAGGGIVNDPESVSLLRRHAITVWLKAAPEDHWERVLVQGDRRPMQNRPDAMAELERLWENRAQHYAEADFVVDTTRKPISIVTHNVFRRLDRAGSTETVG
jgi:XRE family aerobic/anaerobic benzoate catabolism transcriptional regulator